MRLSVPGGKPASSSARAIAPCVRGQTSDAFKNYVKKLADQEPDVERLQKSIKELTQRATREQQEIDNYLNTLNVE